MSTSPRHELLQFHKFIIPNMQVSTPIVHMEDACQRSTYITTFLSLRYQIMLRCWNQDAKKRPKMTAIHKLLESSILTNHYAPSWNLFLIIH